MLRLFFACCGLISLFSTCCLQSAWSQDGEFDDLYLDGGAGNNPFIRFDQADNFHHYIVGFGDRLDFFVENGYKFKIYDSAPSNSLVLDSDGLSTTSLTLADDLQIDASGGGGLFFDIDYSTTAQSFGIRSLDETAGLYGGGIGFSNSNWFYPLWVFDTAANETLALRKEGVAIGTYTAQAPLHVYADGSPFDEAKIVVENQLGATALREMFELVNNGGTQFAFTDTNLGSKWVFASDSVGKFTVSLAGTGGPEISIRPDGRIWMGPGGVKNLDLRSNGNLHIMGTLFQSSDVNLKKAFKDVDEYAVLAKVCEMPITTWQFKSDVDAVRHMGPTAQDFRAAFGLGCDEKTIAPVDGIGVALASIKALNAKVDSKNRQIDELKSQLAEEHKLRNEQSKMIEQLLMRVEMLEAAAQK